MSKLQQFEFIIEGTHSSGRKFRQDFHVFAANREEAFEELRVCMDYYEPVVDWEIKELTIIADVSDQHKFYKDYLSHGAFTLYDPEFHFIDSGGGWDCYYRKFSLKTRQISRGFLNE